MRTFAFIFSFVFASMLWVSCGGGSSSDEKNQETTEEKALDKVNTFNNDLLSFDLGGDWEINGFGAHNKKTDYGIVTFKIDYIDNIYNIFKKQHEVVGDIEETTVDGMPAITGLKKFMQNEPKLTRVWLIFDGTNIIQFSVEAKEKDYDDNVAKELIKKVKVLHKRDNVKLPLSKYIKPASFPEEALKAFQEDFSDDVHLTAENIEKAQTAYNELEKADSLVANMRDDEKSAVLDSILKSNGYESFDDYQKNILKPVFATLTLLSNIDENGMLNKKIKYIAKGYITQNDLSLEDLKFTYDNWDLVSKFAEKAEK